VVLSWGPRFARSDRILLFLHVQVGSPNLSVYAMLVVDIDHEALKGRWGIVGEVPGSKFRNFATTISSSTVVAKIPTVLRRAWLNGLPKRAGTRTRGATSPGSLQRCPRASVSDFSPRASSAAPLRMSLCVSANFLWRRTNYLIYIPKIPSTFSGTRLVLPCQCTPHIPGVSGICD